MSGMATRVDAPLRRAPAKPESARSERIDENIAGLLRLGVFVGFAAFSMAHWLSVIDNPPVGRGMLVVAARDRVRDGIAQQPVLG